MSGFRAFILRGNVVDLAVGIVIGAAFTAVVSGLTEAFLNPLIGVATGATGDVSRRSFTAGGVEFPYGGFVQAVITFLLTALAVYFLVVLPINRLMARYKTEPEPTAPTTACPECLSNIPEAARRCLFCTAPQPAATG